MKIFRWKAIVPLALRVGARLDLNSGSVELAFSRVGDSIEEDSGLLPDLEVVQGADPEGDDQKNV